MIGRPFPIRVALVGLVPVVFHIQGCKTWARSRPLRFTDELSSVQYPTVGGDEAGARISISRGITALVRYVATQGQNGRDVRVSMTAGFVGSDDAEIETLTGSDGASPAKERQRVVVHFDIHN